MVSASPRVQSGPFSFATVPLAKIDSCLQGLESSDPRISKDRLAFARGHLGGCVRDQDFIYAMLAFANLISHM